MYTLIAKIGLARALRVEFVPFLIALTIAQIFFKWGSFSLELLGFVVLWAALGFISDRLTRANNGD